MNEEVRTEKGFERGSALSVFQTDRKEDLVALILSLVIVFLVYFFVD